MVDWLIIRNWLTSLWCLVSQVPGSAGWVGKMETWKKQIQSPKVWEPGESTVQFPPKGWQSPDQEEQMFQFKSEGGLVERTFHQGSALFFPLGLQWIVWGPPTLGREICFAYYIMLIYINLTRNTQSRVLFNQIPGRPGTHSSHYIKLIITIYRNKIGKINFIQHY